MKKTIFAVSLSLVLLAVLCNLFLNPSIEIFKSNEVKVIIDAGHGEPDGGAVAIDGTPESEINLQIALKIYNKLKSNNINCILTRTNESGIFTEGNSIHSKKVSDIRNRVKIANDNKNALFLSIHMNTFPSPDVCGAQVFYKPSSELSKNIASEVQNIINLKFQSENQKKIKTIPSNVYLFKHIPNDCVLIECGFLTNKDDLDKLKNDDFQNSLSESICEAVVYKLFGG